MFKNFNIKNILCVVFVANFIGHMDSLFAVDFIKVTGEITPIVKTLKEIITPAAVVFDLDDTLLTPHTHRCVAKSPFSYSLLRQIRSQCGEFIVCTQRPETEREKTVRELEELGFGDIEILMTTVSLAKGARLKEYFSQKSNIESIIFIDDLEENIADVHSALHNLYELHLFHFTFSPAMLGDFSKYIFPSYEIATARKRNSAAGVLIWALDDRKVPHVLLGFRDDQDTWCNMGGQSDDLDRFLHIAASREVEEETMGLYVFPPECLMKFPSHDLFISNKNMVYRMYFAQGNMIPETIIAKRLSEAKGHSAEYRKIMWFPLSGILDGTLGIELMEDFAHMLKQRPVIERMRQICCIETSIPEFIHTFSHFINDTDSRDYSGLLDEFRYQDQFEALIDEVIQQQSESLTDRFFPTRKAIDPSTLNLSELNPQEKDAVLRAATIDFAGWNTYALSPTQAYLKLILGNEYVEGNIRHSIKENIRRFIESVLFCGAELRRKITPDEEGLERLVDFVEFEIEEYKKGNVVGYHGLDGELLFLYQYMSTFHSLLKGEKLGAFDALRGTHISFIKPKTKQPYSNILEIYDALGFSDYGKERNTLLLCVNHILPIGPGSISLSTSSSLEYFFNSHSVGAPPTRKLMMEMLILLGMNPKEALECFKELNSLYEQFYRYRGGTESVNGGLLAISMSADLTKTHTLLTRGGGKPHLATKHYLPALNDTTVEQRNLPSVVQMIINIQKELEKIDPTRGNFFSLSKEKQERIQLLTNESRIYLDPTKNFSVRGNWHFILDHETQELLNKHFGAMLHVHIARLIRSGSLPIPNSIILSQPQQSIQTRFKEAYQKKFGRALQPVCSGNALPFLIEKGFGEVIKEYIEIFPNALQISPEITQAFLRAVLEGQFEFIDYFDALLKEYRIDQGVHAILSPKNKEFLAITLHRNLPDETTPMDTTAKKNEEKIIKEMKVLFSLIRSEVSEELLQKTVLKLLRSQHYYRFIEEFFSFFNLDKRGILEETFANIISAEQLGNREQSIIKNIMAMGYTLDPSDDVGKRRFESLLERQPTDVLSLNFFRWLDVIGSVIKQYKIHPQRCDLLGDKTLLYKMKCAFPFYYNYNLDETTFNQQDISEYVLSSGFIKPYNILSSDVRGKLIPILSELTGRRYDIGTINSFFDSQLTLCTKAPSEHLWLQAFAEAVKEENLEKVMPLIDQVDNLSILFMNLHLIDDALKKRMKQNLEMPSELSPIIVDIENTGKSFETFAAQHNASDINLFSDALFQAILKKHSDIQEQIKEAMTERKQDEILGFSKTAPLSVMKLFLWHLSQYPNALFNVIERLLMFNPGYFMQIGEALSTDFSYKYFVTWSNFPYLIIKVLPHERNEFLEKLYSIPAARNTLMLQENPARDLLNQSYLVADPTFLSRFFDENSTLEEMIGSGLDEEFNLISSVYERKHEQAKRFLISELFSREICDTNTTYEEYLTQGVQIFEYTQSKKLLKWYGL